MFPIRIFMLCLLAGAMAGIMIATWGSIGSAVMGLGLLYMVSALLYQHFLNREDPDQWDNL